jgi:hypothetical protein
MFTPIPLSRPPLLLPIVSLAAGIALMLTGCRDDAAGAAGSPGSGAARAWRTLAERSQPHSSTIASPSTPRTGEAAWGRSGAPATWSPDSRSR